MATAKTATKAPAKKAAKKVAPPAPGVLGSTTPAGWKTYAAAISIKHSVFFFFSHNHYQIVFLKAPNKEAVEEGIKAGGPLLGKLAGINVRLLAIKEVKI